MLHRRAFLGLLHAAIAAPAVVRSGILMPLRGVVMSDAYVLTGEPIKEILDYVRIYDPVLRMTDYLAVPRSERLRLMQEGVWTETETPVFSGNIIRTQTLWTGVRSLPDWRRL